MPKKRCAIFCSEGIGDGLLFLFLAENFHQNGYETITYHKKLFELQPWVPHLPIAPYPKKLELDTFDHIVINSYDGNKELCDFAKKNYKEKVTILHPSTCKGKTFLGDFRFDIKKNLVDNLIDISRSLGLETACKISFVPRLQMPKEKRRIAIHPTTTSKRRLWPKERYLLLREKLEKRGFSVSFVMSEEERTEWEGLGDLPKLKNLEELASFLYSCGAFIGNDSGVGHLANALGIPTLTIFPSKRKALFWKPGFNFGEVVYPYPLFPNWKGLRLRDFFWVYGVSVERVFRIFVKMVGK